MRLPNQDVRAVDSAGRASETDFKFKKSIQRFMWRAAKIWETGKIIVGAPTGGDKGDGTLNAEEIYEDGKRVFVQEGNATKGLQHTPVDHGTVTSGTLTISPLDGFMHEAICGGAFQIDVPTNLWGSAVLHITNAAGAGEITFSSNLQKKYPSAKHETTNGNKFSITFYFFGTHKADYSVQPRQ